MLRWCSGSAFTSRCKRRKAYSRVCKHQRKAGVGASIRAHVQPIDTKVNVFEENLRVKYCSFQTSDHYNGRRNDNKRSRKTSHKTTLHVIAFVFAGRLSDDMMGIDEEAPYVSLPQKSGYSTNPRLCFCLPLHLYMLLSPTKKM